MSEIVIKSVETKTGVQFRVLKDDKFVFLHATFQNYFYVKTSDYLSSEEEFLKQYKFCIGDVTEVGQFVKIQLTNNFMRVKVRAFWEERCNTYEADIKANKRFLLDKHIKLNNTEIPYTFYDIETDDRKPMQKDERGIVIPGNARILSFSATDYKGKQIYYELNSETDEDEKALLTMIIDYFSNYGIISGWNSENFDMAYIKGRCDSLQVSYVILDYINHMDYMELFKKYDKKSRGSYSLNSISNEVLKESKVDQEKGNGAIYNTWLNDKEQLRRYNMEDSNLVYKINSKMMFIQVSMKRADNAGCHVINTVNNSDSGDFLLMREYKNSNIIMPSQPTKEEVEKRKEQGSIGGGHTTCFMPGFHRNVKVWDFKCLDPDTIITTTNGFKKLRDLKIDEDEVFNYQGKFNILAKGNRLHEEYFKIILDTGDELKCSGDHKIPTYSGLKYVKDLSIKDKLFIETDIFKENIKDPYILETMKILGLFLAEGSLLEVGKTNEKPYYSIRFSLHKKEKYLETMIYNYFQKNFNYTPRTYYKGDNGMRVVITSKEIFYHFNHLMKELPKLLMHRDTAIEYIRYFMEGDGSYNISRKTIQVSQSEKNKGKLKLIYDLLKNLGIPCRFFKTYARCNNKKIDIYKIEIRYVKEFEEKIGFAFKKCSFNYENQKHKSRGHIKSIELIKEQINMIDIAVEKEHYFIANNILTHNSEYPSVIQTWNISPETYIETIHNDKDAERIDRNKYIITPSDFEGIYHPSRVYRKDEGVIPRVVRRLVDERDKIKYPMKLIKDKESDEYKQLYLEQYALKTDANSIYGILAFPQSRYYSWELGDSVTTCARATLKSCYQTLQSWGCTVLGGDTDSTFVIINEYTPEKLDKMFEQFLENWANKFGCVINKLVFEYEKEFDTMLFVKKKNYAYLMKGEIHITGLEAIKSDANLLAATLQKEFIYEVLLDNYSMDAWQDKMEYIYNKVFNQDMTAAELTLVKALTKMPKDYEGATIDSKTGKPKIKADGSVQQKSIPAHVKLAERMITQGKDLYPGTKIKFIVIKEKPILAISPEEFMRQRGRFNYKHKKHGDTIFEWEGDYCAPYYWLRIIRPLIKVLYAYHQTIPEWNWQITEGEFNKILKTQNSEDEEEEE